MKTKETQIEDIERQVHKFFSQLGETARQEGWHKDSEWTVGINRYLTQLGHKHGFLVFASRCEIADGKEWLYDHHWRSLNDKGNLVSIPLAMEIEWGFGAKNMREKVVEDFTKLIQARAQLRVMVFQGNSIESTLDELQNMVQEFADTQIGDRYLLAGWGWDTEKIHMRPLII
ncbi:MAG: hypothetical protein LAN71_18005 [Acidobacteriia bacterium]|nr:hypothetical protein [Terriglobia bacterium]